MAKQTRKQASARPVTTHQLFPAVVALWFGALFGLGSLAVRPLLLESLVIKSRIDLIVPAAAPPLGITARILVALVLAAIGAVIGITLARRLSRPKQELRERKRGAGSVSEENDKLRGGHHYADAKVRAPLSVSEELRPYLEGEAGNFGTSGLAPRRRSLAIEHEEVDFVPHDMAPLPGGVPQILDIGEVRITSEAVEAPLDLNAFAAPANPVALDWINAAPVQSAPGVGPQAPHQAFGMAPPVQTEEPVRQIFGQTVTDDHVDLDFVKAAGFKTTVFDVEEPSPLFVPRQSSAAPAAVPEAYVPSSQLDQAPALKPAPHAAFAAPLAVEPAFQPAPVVAPVPAMPLPTSLGMDDLASRFAESMARRRAARTGQPEAPVAVPAAAPVPVTFEVPVAPTPIPIAYVPEVQAEPQPAAIPQSMRPLDLGGFEEDHAPLDGLVPPRMIAMPAAFGEPAPAQPAVQPAPVDEAEIANDGVSEDYYGSLLGVAPVAPARTGFVRIDGPEPEVAAIEPVLIFPGQMVQPIAPVSSEDAGSFRRFDAPASAGQGQPIAANQAPSEVDSEEAQRALRSALANLQRMSGAA